MGLFQGLLLGHPAQGLAVLNRIFGVSTLDGTSGVSAFGHSPEYSPGFLETHLLKHVSVVMPSS